MNQATRDSYDRTFAELKSRNEEIRQRVAQSLRQSLEAAQRESISPAEFSEIYKYVVQRATSLVLQGNETQERVGGIQALSALIDFKGDDAAQKTTRFANCLRGVMRGTDTVAMVHAARALGRLALPGNPLTAELVDSEVKAALESLQGDRQEHRRFAAVLTLRELAKSSPTLLYGYVPQILEIIWAPLRDPKVLIREYAAEAVSACFEIIAARDPLMREQWFVRIWEEISTGFKINTVESIHGSLLASKELLLKGGMFVQTNGRYQQACDRVYAYREHRDPLIRREVTALIPVLAGYYPTQFSNQYLHKFMIYLQGQLKKEKDRNPSFLAIGKVASAVGSAISPYLDGIIVYIRDALSVKARNRGINDGPVFQCISMVAISVGQTLTKYMGALLDPIFACGLSDALTQALVDMAHYIPLIKPTIQEKLLELLSQVLSGRPFSPLGSPSHGVGPVTLTRDPKDPQQVEQRQAEIALALQTLGSFDFSGYILNEFVRDVAIRYVDDDDPAIRKASALTCCQLLVKDRIVHQVSQHAVNVVSGVIEKLLAVAVSDPDPEIRNSVLISLDARFNRHLARAENIRTLFLALNDEAFMNREAAMSIIGRLASVNPAYVFPSLRKALIQLLTEMEYSNNARNKQESALLISHLVESSSTLIKPYVDPIIAVLLPKASDADENVAATTLKAIGDLSTVGGEEMLKYVPQLMSIIIRHLHDLSSSAKCSAALKTLGQVASSSGYVVDPYLDHSELLSILVSIAKTEPQGLLRRETIRVMGILGALDPYKHLQVVEESPEHNLAAETQAVTDVSLIMSGITPSNEDFYPTVVISTLMGLLKDPALVQYHQNVIDAVMNIYATMGLKCVNFLNQIIPGFVAVLKEAPSSRVEGYFNQLSQLVRIVRQHIRPYLAEVLETVQTFWYATPQAHSTILSLIEAIARSLEGEFKVYLARVLPLMLGVLDEDRSPKRGPSERVLHAFLVFGSSAEEYMHLIIPVIIRMFEKPGQPQSIRRSAIETLGRLSRQVNISDFAAKIVHPLARVLAGNDTYLKQTALDTLCALVFQLGTDYLHFIPTIDKMLVANRVPHSNYSLIVSKLQKGEPLPQDLSPGEYYGEDEDEQRPAEIATKKLAVNQQHLKNAWEASDKSTREDWSEWIRRLSIELLKESPQQALRACFPLASVHPPTAKALFNSAFVSCWTELYEQYQDALVQNIEIALTSANISPEILQILLNLAEFMEHDDKSLPIDIRTLGMYAGKCFAWAKALHYKELEFMADSNPSCVEALISINNNLQQTDAAFGMLAKAQTYNDVDLKETWFEKLHKWDRALEAYQERERTTTDPDTFDITMGKMRCLHALGEWELLSSLAEDKWVSASADPKHQRAIAPLAAAASWGLAQWELMDKYVNSLKPDSPDRSFFGAILSIHRNQYDDAYMHIDKAREGLDTELVTLLGESYNRAYSVIVRVQMLAELEEIISYKQSYNNKEKQETMRKTWSKRLLGCQRNVEVWQRMLKVRSLVISAQDNETMHIKFANLCRKAGRPGLTEKSLRTLVRSDKTVVSDLSEEPLLLPAQKIDQPSVSYAILKYMWSKEQKAEALLQLKEFTSELFGKVQALQRGVNAQVSHMTNGATVNGFHGEDHFMHISGAAADQSPATQIAEMQRLMARCHLKQGEWQTAMQQGDWNHEHVHEILSSYAAATRYDSNWYKAWHAWALANFEVVTSITSAADRERVEISTTTVIDHVVPAIQGFFKSIALSSSSSLQDTLRLLTLWFAHGGHQQVNTAVQEGFQSVSIDTWLEVIPQLIARINQPNLRVRNSIQNLLVEVGRAHPQALVYPLTVSMKSDTSRRSAAAGSIMEAMRQHSPKLVDQADLVSHELIRIAVLWHEQWHEGLEEASRLYFGDHNIEGMLQCLAPLHEMIDRGAETLREISFTQSFARDLNEARGWCQSYQRTHDVGDLNQAWDMYYQVFRKIARQLPQLMSLELQYVSPKLKTAVDLDLAVPGTYQPHKPVVRIAYFDPVSNVIQSKQRPRRLTLKGSDGVTYAYALKGHEDIRQDERVMQLFGLVNTLLANDPECTKRHLNIQRYAAIPLSTQSGLLGWVPNSDTLHVLIREYRDSRKILLNIEHRIMLQMAPDYDNLTLMQKVEVFSYAMDNTTGQDLYRVLWLKSKSSEAWLGRRTTYIRSLGVMSMVGYILGLGDRHPSNLMLDRVTGKVVHIDFGDCFEVAMHREKYPERVPFRLTRMLTFAMEVSNIEGTFRTTCELVMGVLRGNRESLMAVLEAFIHDPLLTWRLNTRESPVETSFPSERRASIMGVPEGVAIGSGATPSGARHPAASGSFTGRPRTRSSMSGPRPTNLTNGAGSTDANSSSAVVGAPETARQVGPNADPGQQKEVQNARALQVLSRVKEKLTGRDFPATGSNRNSTAQPAALDAGTGVNSSGVGAGGILPPLNDANGVAVTPVMAELGVDEQVNKLINEATSLENLCQHYIGWCSFW